MFYVDLYVIDLPLAFDPVSMFLQAIITLAPRLARSLAVSFPIPKRKKKTQVHFIIMAFVLNLNNKQYQSCIL